MLHFQAMTVGHGDDHPEIEDEEDFDERMMEVQPDVVIHDVLNDEDVEPEEEAETEAANAEAAPPPTHPMVQHIKNEAPDIDPIAATN